MALSDHSFVKVRIITEVENVKENPLLGWIHGFSFIQF